MFIKKCTIIGFITISSLSFASDYNLSSNHQSNILQSPQNTIDASSWITIPAGSRTLNENKKHADVCQSMGGIDITNDSDIKVGKGTLDIVFCKIVDMVKYNQTESSITGIVDTSDISFQSTYVQSNFDFDELNGTSGNVTAQAANGSVPMNQMWWVQGAGVYSNINHQNVAVSINVPDFGCAGTNPLNNLTGGATITVRVYCAPSQGRTSTTDYVSACINTPSKACANASGVIKFY